MRQWLLQTLCLLALTCAPLAHAQVYHCIGAHGEPVFSGEPCGTPAPAPDQKAAAQQGVLGGVCADSPRELQQAIAAAFATHDVNRLAGLILWLGVDQASARGMMRSLTAWLAQPLVDIAVAYPAKALAMDTGPTPPIPAIVVPASDASTAAPPPGGFEITTGGSAGGARYFGVTQSGSCWWLTF